MMYKNNWFFHETLQWDYIPPKTNEGLWIWMKDFGWIWTKEDVWPFLWNHTENKWIYLIKGKNGDSLFYDYSTHSWNLMDDVDNGGPLIHPE